MPLPRLAPWVVWNPLLLLSVGAIEAQPRADDRLDARRRRAHRRAECRLGRLELLLDRLCALREDHLQKMWPRLGAVRESAVSAVRRSGTVRCFLSDQGSAGHSDPSIYGLRAP